MRGGRKKVEFHQSCGQRKECGTLLLNHKGRWFGFHSFSGFITLSPANSLSLFHSLFFCMSLQSLSVSLSVSLPHPQTNAGSTRSHSDAMHSSVSHSFSLLLSPTPWLYSTASRISVSNILSMLKRTPTASLTLSLCVSVLS